MLSLPPVPLPAAPQPYIPAPAATLSDRLLLPLPPDPLPPASSYFLAPTAPSRHHSPCCLQHPLHPSSSRSHYLPLRLPPAPAASPSHSLLLLLPLAPVAYRSCSLLLPLPPASAISEFPHPYCLSPLLPPAPAAFPSHCLLQSCSSYLLLLCLLFLLPLAPALAAFCSHCHPTLASHHSSASCYLQLPLPRSAIGCKSNWQWPHWQRKQGTMRLCPVVFLHTEMMSCGIFCTMR